MRVAGNKAAFTHQFGRPANGDWRAADAWIQEQAPQSPTTQSPAPGLPIGPGGIMDTRRQANNLLLRQPQPSTARQPDINDRKADYTDFKTKGWAMGSTARGRNAIGGVTNFPNMNDPSFGGYSGGGMRPEGSRTIGRGTPPVPDMFGRQFGQPAAPDPGFDPGPAPMGTTTDGDNIGRLRMNAPRPWKTELPGYADGGEVDGPGGPKDDMVPAMLSDGEFIMPAEAVKFFGLDRLHKMTQKAKEGMMEMPTGSADIPVRSGASKADKDVRAPSMMMHFAAGGFVNPYADDPMAYAVRQQQAKDASLASFGGADMGGGRVAFVNRYGSGYAVPATDPMATAGPGMFGNNGDAMTAVPGKGLMPMPDIIPSGPWSSGALPYDPRDTRQSIASMIPQMQAAAPDARALDLAANASRLQYTPKGRGMITVPDATTRFPQVPDTLNDGHFLSPSEKDAMATAARNAPIQPFLDAGMKKSDIRQMMKDPKFVMQQQKRRPLITPEMAAQMGQELASIDSSGNMQFRAAKDSGPTPQQQLDQLETVMTTDPNLANREKALRKWKELTQASRSMPSLKSEVRQGEDPATGVPQIVERKAGTNEFVPVAVRGAESATITSPAVEVKGPTKFEATATTSREQIAALPKGTPIYRDGKLIGTKK